ncbi:HK97 family phage prohead protease [Aurantimonas coralicida]|uniref:HK97 family phage prohead protease n=1 Tax=Aurantimonas coralicida TaxID=182270 RepID=UPI001D17F639|nr:HK97 family phage prohead protease [Aurantimonas coralicida]MCC4298432.1 HK97 family phage prohead protease [Aurantimonas coralicida]
MSDKVVKIADVKAEGQFAPETARGLRSAELTPSSLTDDGKITFVLATPQPVIRWYRDLDTYERFQAEEVLPTETAILMDESGRSIPLLNSHRAWDADHVIGVVTKMWRESGVVMCEAQLSGRESVKDLVDGIREGVLRNFSVGYDILETELVTDTATGKRTMRAKRWLILEASLVPVPADANAQIRSATDLVVDWRRTQTNTEETDMTEEQIRSLVTDAVRTALETEKSAREAAEAEKRSKESTEVTTTAPTTGERSAEDTAAIAGLRSAAVSYSCEAGFDAMDKAGATVAELRSMVMSGARKHSASPDVDGGAPMGGSRHAEQLPDFRTAFRSAFGGAQ